MTTFATTLRAERWLDEVIIGGRATDAGGAESSHQFSLPAGIGDLAIIEILFEAVTFATQVANPDLLAIQVDVLSPDAAAVVDIVGVARWSKTQTATTLAAYLSPDPLVLVRQNELIRFKTPELDSNGAPTADIDMIAKLVRVRPIETPASPVQLVR